MTRYMNSHLTLGGYEREQDRIYKDRPVSYERGYQLHAHRIAGSFHWELKLNGFAFGNGLAL